MSMSKFASHAERRRVMRAEQEARRADPEYMRVQSHVGTGACLFSTINVEQVHDLEAVFTKIDRVGWHTPAWLKILRVTARISPRL